MGTLEETLEAQKRASDPLTSAWVSANAGTGKTHVLTQRVIRLLLNGTAPERILCLTFTKAAASEMARRLFEDLGTWTTMPDEELVREIDKRTGEEISLDRLPQARRLFAQALETPGGLKIQTIHAFCERLLRQFPLEAQVPPEFDVLEDRVAEELLYLSRVELLDEALEDEEGALGQAHKNIVGRLDESGFEGLLSEVQSKRNALQAFIHLNGGVAGAAERLREERGLEEGETSSTLTSAFFVQVDKAFIREAIGVFSNSKGTYDLAQAERLSFFLESQDEREAFQIYQSVFLTQNSAPRSRRSLISQASVKAGEPIGLLDFLEAETTRILAAAEKLKALTIIDASVDLLALADRFLSLYQAAKTERAALDYDDLITTTGNLLSKSESAAWVLYKLDGGIDHILVDEAQDTSPGQWSVISSLSDEFFSGLGARQDRDPESVRTIFAVGDEKQSIYSFQGAEPAKFREMEGFFEQQVRQVDLEWVSESFGRSFRSVSTILDAVDEICSGAPIMSHLMTGDEWVSHLSNREGEGGRVEIWPLITLDDSEGRDNPDVWRAPLDRERSTDPHIKLARQIAEQIRHWIDTEEILASQGRPIEPGDILILVRRRAPFMDPVIRELKRLNVPVTGIDRMHLTDQLAVMDLLALAEFLLQPADDLTLATVLKSPLIGLSEDDLLKLAYAREGTLWAALEKAQGDQGQFRQAYEYLHSLLNIVDFIPPFEFFSDVLDGSSPSKDLQERTGRARLLARLGADANDPLDEFLNLALTFEQNAVPTLQGFLYWLSISETELKREQEQGSGQVRVMTAHGAKGLDANIVFLPDTCKLPGGAKVDRLLKSDNGAYVWGYGGKVNFDPHTLQARETYLEKEAAEYDRLLYVAATRARDRLYVSGYYKTREPLQESWYYQIRDALLDDMEEITLLSGEVGWRLEHPQEAPIPFSEEVSSSLNITEELPPWLYERVKPEPLMEMPKAPSRIGAVDEEVRDTPCLSPLVEGRETRFKRGQLIHKMLELLPAIQEEKRLAVAQEYLSNPKHDLTKFEIDDLIEEIASVLSDAAFADLFKSGSRAEVPIVGTSPRLPEGGVVSGIVDRLAVTEDQVLVVDYKTNRPPPETLEGVSPLYWTQMAVYRALLQEIYPDRLVRCALLWTDGPRLMELPSSGLDSTLAKLQ